MGVQYYRGRLKGEGGAGLESANVYVWLYVGYYSDWMLYGKSISPQQVDSTKNPTIHTFVALRLDYCNSLAYCISDILSCGSMSKYNYLEEF